MNPILSIQTLRPGIAKQEGEILALLTVRHPDMPVQRAARPNLNVAFAIDISGSMAGVLKDSLQEQEKDDPSEHIGTIFHHPSYIPVDPGLPGLPGLPGGPGRPATSRLPQWPVPGNKQVQMKQPARRQSSKLDRVKQAVNGALDALQPCDRFSIVVFDGRARVILDSCLASETAKLRARQLLNELSPGSSTALHDGWKLAAQMVAKNLDSSSINRVLLLTDGEATDGITDAATLSAHAAEMVVHNVSTSTFGVGDYFNEDLLQSMAESGDGRYVYLENAQLYDSVFINEFNGLAQVYGHRVTLSGNTSIECQVDFLNDLPIKNGCWALPNAKYGKTEQFLIKFTPKQKKLKTEQVVINFVYTYHTKESSQSKALAHALPVVTTAALAKSKVNNEVEKKQLELQSARDKALAMAELDKGNVIRSQHILATSRSTIEASAYAQEPEFQLAASRLGTLMTVSESGDSNKLRKMAMSDAYKTRVGE